MKHTLPELPYAMEALAPKMSRETLEYHYGKHLKTYVDNLNRLIAGTPYEELPLDEIVRTADGALFNNAAQAWNHEFFFDQLSPDGEARPTGALLKAIDAATSARSRSSARNSRRRLSGCSDRVGYGLSPTGRDVSRSWPAPMPAIR